MRRVRNLFVIALSLAAALCLSVRFHGVNAEEYTYTVRVFAGNQGTIGGSDVYVVKDLHYGDHFEFDFEKEVTVTDSEKYYVKGLRLAGEDNESLFSAAFDVESDTDLVVTYGVKGDQIPYTVRYVSVPDNKEIAKPETFYGNPGDRPVIACRHIAGYEPRWPKITGTVEEGKEFVIEYTRVNTEGGEGETTVITTTTVVDGGTETVTVNQGNNAGGGQQNAGAAAAQNNAAADAAGGDNPAGNAEAAPAANNTEEIHDIDVPLAENGNSAADNAVQPSGGHRGVSPVVIGGAAGGAVLLGIAGALYARYRHG